MGETLAVIIPAAGRSIRFGGPTNKLLTTLAGRRVIDYAVAAFLQRADVAQIIIPTSASAADAPPAPPPVQATDPRIVFAPGGASRAQSVLNGLLGSDPSATWIAVHDAARPLVSQGLIDRTLTAARRHGAAVPAMPVNLTIKQATGPLPARVERTIPRATLWAMQTPQIMRRSSLLAAYERCPLPLEQITDDVQLLELAGEEVWLVQGEEQNLKITTPGDLTLAEMFLAAN